MPPITTSKSVSYTHLDVYKRQALGGVGQDAERIAGVQDTTGLLGAPPHLVDVCLQNHLHIGDLIGKIAPGGLQVNDRADLAGAEVGEVGAGVGTDKDGAVLAGQMCIRDRSATKCRFCG